MPAAKLLPSANATAPGDSAEAYQPLCVVVAAVVVGMIGDRYVWSAVPHAVDAAALLAFAALGAWLLGSRLKAGPRTLLLLVATAALGAAWHHDRHDLFDELDLGLFARDDTQPVVVEAIALTSPRFVPAPPFTALRSIPKGDQTEFPVRVVAARHGQEWKPAAGIALVDVDGHVLGVRAGDKLRVYALATKPNAPLNPGEFDYAEYQRGRRIMTRLRGLFPENIQVLEKGPWWHWRTLLAMVRDRGNWELHRHIGGRRASLAAAILLGAREQLNAEQNEGFLVTGTIHVLSISGVHVGILVYGFFLIARTGIWRGRSLFVATIAFTALYALLTDAQPPVVRAAVLIILMCVARLMGRQALGFNSLAAAALAVAAWDPVSLFSAGTQLSFLAVAVMILFREWIAPEPTHDPLDRLLAQSRPWFVRGLQFAWMETWRVIVTGTVIWIVSLPLVWYAYNLVSPVGLAMNPLVWLPITAALFAGFGTVAFGLVFPPAADLCGWICDRSLQAIEWCIDSGQVVPWGYWWAPAPPLAWVVVFYLVFGLMAWQPRWRPSYARAAALFTLWLGVAVVTAGHWYAQATTPGERPLVCTFVAVGHGTACVLEFPNGRTILYDGGRLGSPVASLRPISCTLWSRGITHLDAIIISHADADHYNAVPELLTRFTADYVLIGPTMFERPIAALNELKTGIEEAAVPMRVLTGGDEVQLDPEVRIAVLHPPRRGVIGSDNANSIVLAVEYAGRRLLLPGDLETPGLDDLLAEDPLDTDVAMAPHHGSTRSNPAGFTAWSTPEFVVISGARDPDNPEQLREVRRALGSLGGQVHHTADFGAVRFFIEKEKVRVETYRGGEWSTRR